MKPLRGAKFPGRIMVYAGNLQREELRQFRALAVDEVVMKANLPQLVAAVAKCAPPDAHGARE